MTPTESFSMLLGDSDVWFPVLRVHLLAALSPQCPVMKYWPVDSYRYSHIWKSEAGQVCIKSSFTGSNFNHVFHGGKMLI